jgi:hypothetical protein
MSETNVAVVRGMLEAFLCSDFETSLAAFDVYRKGFSDPDEALVEADLH